MFVRHLVLAGAIVLTTSGLALAQDLRGPRELPPAGFTGQQWVDSRGCVFLRAGVAGRTNWVPRVSANRRQLCGFPPSFTPAPAAVAEAPAAPAPAPAARPASPRRAGAPIETVATTTAPPRISAPAPRNRVPAASYAPPPVAVAAAAPAAPAPAPRPAPAAAPARAVAERTAGCPAHAPYGQRLLTTDGRSALLCVASPDRFPAFARKLGVSGGRVPAPAPDPVGRSVAPAAAPVAVASAAPAAPVARAAAAPVSLASVPVSEGIGPTYLAGGDVVCPAEAPFARRFALRGGGTTLLCVAEGGGGAVAAGASRGGAKSKAAVATASTSGGVVVPRGYRAAWSDDRLNPRRGMGTAEGWAMQDQVWTRTVPAELVTAAPAHRRASLSSSGATGASALAPVPAAKPRKAAAPKVVLSTSAAAVPKAPAAAAAKKAPAAGGRFYVQVGSFGVPENAARARSRLGAMGLPVAMGRGTIKGRAVQVVHAGPFATEAQARAALAAARGAGFGDAFLRR